MKYTQPSLRFALLTASALIIVACNSDPKTTNKEITLETDDQRLSYILGNNLAKQALGSDMTLDIDAVLMGIDDANTEKTDRLSQEDIRTAVANIQNRAREKQKAARAAAMEKNVAEGEAFLAANAKRDGVVVTETGLQYKEIKPGSGATPGPADRVTVHYEGTLIDGTVFDSSYTRNSPATFGVGGVIAGWTEALQLMNVGDTFELTIPGNLAYGERGSGAKIGPGATLLFKVELLGIAE